MNNFIKYIFYHLEEMENFLERPKLPKLERKII